MAKTAREGYRHAEAVIDFFLDVGYVTREAVGELIEYHKKNKHFRQSLKRLTARGIIRETTRGFALTPKGIIYALKKRPPRELKKPWDGKWRLVSFDVPTCDNSKRAFLRGLLKEFGFYKLQGSVWVCPNHFAENFWKLVVHYDLEQYCKVMLVEVLEGDEELKEYFKLGKKNG